MPNIFKFGTSLWRDRRGQDFLEYAFICAFVALAAVSTLGAINAVSDRLGVVMQVLMAAITRLSPASPSGF